MGKGHGGDSSPFYSASTGNDSGSGSGSGSFTFTAPGATQFGHPFGAARAAAGAATAVKEVSSSIKKALQAAGGVYAEYSCKEVSWDDSSRSHGGVGGFGLAGGLSSGGSNITDTYLKARDDTRLFTVRSDNWNEKLGVVSARDVALIAGNTQGDCSSLAPALLEDVLSKMEEIGSYAGVEAGSNLSSAIDSQVSIRFQTTFIPVEDKGPSTGGRGTLEFATEAYNYQTRSDDDPRNLVLLATSQGLAVQQDGRGKQKLFHHSARPGSRSVARHWLEAEASSHKVGGAQQESEEEKADALARGKATAAVIGTRQMGTRFNVLMTIQVPLEQQPRAYQPGFSFGGAGGGFGFGAGFGGGGGGGSKGFGSSQKALTTTGGFGFSAQGRSCFAGSTSSSCGAAPASFGVPCGSAPVLQQTAPVPMYGGAAPASFGAPLSCTVTAPVPMYGSAPVLQQQQQAAPAHMYGGAAVYRSIPNVVRRPAAPAVGTSSAARVSIGSKHDDWNGLAVKKRLKRHPTERITVTVVLYNAVSGGVPSESDVIAAIDDLEALYASCSGGSGHLADSTFDVFKNGGASGSAAALPPALPPAVTNSATFPAPAQGPLPLPPAFLGTPTQQGPLVVKFRAHHGASEVVKQLVDDKVDESMAGFNYVHDVVALPWLEGGVGGGRIADAFHAFRASNDLHLLLTGLPHPGSLYNLSCCVAVAVRDDPTGVLISSGMIGPQSSSSGGASSFSGGLFGQTPSFSRGCLAAARGPSSFGSAAASGGSSPKDEGLKVALTWLKMARAAGYTNTAHMNSDPDLSELRKQYGVL